MEPEVAVFTFHRDEKACIDTAEKQVKATIRLKRLSKASRRFLSEIGNAVYKGKRS